MPIAVRESVVPGTAAMAPDENGAGRLAPFPRPEILRSASHFTVAEEEAVTVRVQEPMPGDWEMIQESQKHTKDSACVDSWNVAGPADGKVVLDYTVRVKW